MDVAVGVRRPVVQNEAQATGRRGADRFVNLAPLPVLHPAGFPPREVSSHRKRRIRQIECCLVVGFGIVGHCFFLRRSTRGGEIFACLRHVGANLRGQRRQVVVLLFIAQLAQEFDIHAPPVNRLVEIEHEHFQ